MWKLGSIPMLLNFPQLSSSMWTVRINGAQWHRYLFVITSIVAISSNSIPYFVNSTTSKRIFMMTSSNGNNFRVTGLLWGEASSHRSFYVFFHLRLNKRPSAKPLSQPMMVSFLTHTCVTRSQWVKGHIVIINSLYIKWKMYCIINYMICGKTNRGLAKAI